MCYSCKPNPLIYIRFCYFSSSCLIMKRNVFLEASSEVVASEFYEIAINYKAPTNGKD